MEIEWNIPDESIKPSIKDSTEVKRNAPKCIEKPIEIVWGVPDYTQENEKSNSSKETAFPYKIKSNSAINISEISKTIDENKKSKEDLFVLCESYLEKIISSLEAERGFILIYEKTTSDPRVYASLNINPDKLLLSEPVSHSVLRKVIEEKKSIVITDALQDPYFGNLTSVVISGLRSIICVPIQDGDELLGILYIDNRLKKGAFDKTHLGYLEEFAQEISKRIKKFFPQIKAKN